MKKIMAAIAALSLMLLLVTACTRGADADAPASQLSSSSEQSASASVNIEDDGSVTNENGDPIAYTSISVYNGGGHLITTVSAGADLDALADMLANAPEYTGEDLHLDNPAYRLEAEGDTLASYDLWLRNGSIYFKATGQDTVYAPVGMDISEFKQIINDK